VARSGAAVHGGARTHTRTRAHAAHAPYAAASWLAQLSALCGLQPLTGHTTASGGHALQLPVAVGDACSTRQQRGTPGAAVGWQAQTQDRHSALRALLPGAAVPPTWRDLKMLHGASLLLLRA
jgi:hypothetical protein